MDALSYLSHIFFCYDVHVHSLKNKSKSNFTHQLYASNVKFFFRFSVFFLTFKTNSIKNCCSIYKPYIHIAVFLLCETTLILCLIILRTVLSRYQTSIMSLVMYNLAMFTLILYMAMNMSNHLRLIYWEIRKVSSLNI